LKSTAPTKPTTYPKYQKKMTTNPKTRATQVPIGCSAAKAKLSVDEPALIEPKTALQRLAEIYEQRIGMKISDVLKPDLRTTKQ
jgi:hypothetical protein